jgi:hypothetical protein
VQERHKDACLAFGLLATPSIVFLVMFMPKGRQLAAMGREDIYIGDREERFSASSRTGSGYSPSFFHFKPIKYGNLGMMTGKDANGGIERDKHQQAVTTLGGGKFHFVFLNRHEFALWLDFQTMHLSFHYPTTLRHCTIIRTTNNTI